jgi:type VI protein secretion system component VasF
MPELIWDAKYQDGKKAGPVRIELPFHTDETVNESTQESPEVPFKDRAATEWCENATSLTGVAWRYRKVPQGAFDALRPTALADLAAPG